MPRFNSCACGGEPVTSWKKFKMVVTCSACGDRLMSSNEPGCPIESALLGWNDRQRNKTIDSRPKD